MSKKQETQKAITLVLSGGAAKGLSAIGVIEVLKENKIPIKRIVGISAGALIGAAYCTNQLNQLKEFLLSLSKWKLFRLFFSLPTLTYVCSLRKLDKILRDMFKNTKLENLKTQLTVVAYNITKEKKEVFKKGTIFNAIRASLAAPGFFKPYKINNSKYVDGAVIQIVPVEEAKKFKEKIVAVNVENIKSPSFDKWSMLGILDRSIYAKTKELARLNEQGADLIIHPEVPYKHFEYYRAEEIINIGRKSALKALPQIKKLI